MGGEVQDERVSLFIRLIRNLSRRGCRCQPRSFSRQKEQCPGWCKVEMSGFIPMARGGLRGPAGNGLRCEQRGEEILTARVAVQWLGRKVVPGFAERFSAPREPPARLTNQPGKQPIRLGRFHDDVGDISSPQHGIKSSHIF